MAHQADCQGQPACEVKASDEANDLLVARHGWIRIDHSAEPWPVHCTKSCTYPVIVHCRVNTGLGAACFAEYSWLYIVPI